MLYVGVVEQVDHLSDCDPDIGYDSVWDGGEVKVLVEQRTTAMRDLDEDFVVFLVGFVIDLGDYVVVYCVDWFFLCRAIYIDIVVIG